MGLGQRRASVRAYGVAPQVRETVEASRTNLPRIAAGRRWIGVLLTLAGASVVVLVVGQVLAGTVVGGAEDERLISTGSSETLAGRGGNDAIYGFAGGDGLSGGEGNDELYGGKGRDALIGGAGNDFLEAKDSAKDFVGCGAGHDVASADQRDEVSSDCEVVYRP